MNERDPKRKRLVVLLFTLLLVLGITDAANAAPINWALSGTATQISTVTPAELAIDGNTDGNYYNASVTHTGKENQPWWQVDLGIEREIGEIVVWNRTDDASERLTNFRVSILNSGQAEEWGNDYFTSGGYPDPSLSIPFSVPETGQYVKVQLNGTDTYLHMAEVQVFGAVPLPAAVWLLGSGVIGLVVIRRKDRG